MMKFNNKVKIVLVLLFQFLGLQLFRSKIFLKVFTQLFDKNRNSKKR